MRFIALKLIRLYQKTLSTEHGILRGVFYKTCRFYPTCSEYTYRAIKKYGILKGSFQGLKRILRCHPLNRGGCDPL